MKKNEGHKYAKRVCEYCGKEYWPTGNRQKFCCSECKEKNSREKLLAKRYEEKGNHTFKQKECVVCGKKFWPRNGQQRVCSDECKQKHYREYHKELYENTIAPRIKAENLENKKKRLAENDGHMYPKRTCEYCGKEYWPNVAHQKYCCKECGKKASRTDAKGPENMSVIPALLETAGA